MVRLTLKDEEYFKVMELKGKYGEKGLYGLLVKLDSLASKDINTNKDKAITDDTAKKAITDDTAKKAITDDTAKKAITDIKANKDKTQKERICRKCGHNEDLHDEDRCYGVSKDGDACRCKQGAPQN